MQKCVNTEVIGEHLTRETSTMFTKARIVVKEKRLYGAWTRNGLLYIKLNESQESKIIKIVTTSDLDQFWLAGSYP